MEANETFDSSGGGSHKFSPGAVIWSVIYETSHFLSSNSKCPQEYGMIVTNSPLQTAPNMSIWFQK